MAAFQIGDEVCARNPGERIEGASCIIGHIDEIVEVNGEPTYRFDADVPVKTAPFNYETQRHRVCFRAGEIFHRPAGIPLSQINGNAMDRHLNPEGWANWIAVSQSWGHQ